MFSLLTSLVGVLGVVTVSVLASLTNASVNVPNMAVVFTVYAAARRDVFGALVTALIVGLVAGVELGGARGVTLLGLLFVIGVTRWARVRFPLERRWALAAWVAVASVIADVVTVVIGFLVLPGLALSATLVRVTPIVALVTAVAALPAFLLLDWVEPLLRARQERSSFLR